jgi:Na+/H+ antiporter NhaA
VTTTARGAQQTRRRQLSGQLSGPLRRFLATESGSAVLLVGAAVVALAWANSPWSPSYEALWATRASVEVGGAGIDMDLGHWINDGAMAVFFFVIGLEVRRDLAVPGSAAWPSLPCSTCSSPRAERRAPAGVW